MNASRARLHSLRQARAHFSVASLLGVLALSATSLQAAPAAKPGNADTPDDAADARRSAKRDNLGADQPRRPAPFAIFDTDHNGVVSAAEIDAAPDVLRAHDKNGDGQLSGRELMPPRPPGQGNGAGAPPPPPPDEN